MFRTRKVVAPLLLFALVIAIAALLVDTAMPTISSGSENSGLALAREYPTLPHLNITFAANSTAEVESLITTDQPYIRAGDSFDLDSGSPSNLSLNLTAINYWASLLHAAYPKTAIYAHTSGLAHFATLAAGVNRDISAIYYDYEPGYEPEFTRNFTQTVADFVNATIIAHAHGLQSVGYPFGRPIDNPGWTKYHWDFGKLAEVVDQLVVQTQRYCQDNTSDFQTATSIVLGQYAADHVAGSPIFQVTLGINATVTPNQVDPQQAYACARVLTNDGLRSLFLWWGPGDNSGVVQFLRDIGRHARS